MSTNICNTCSGSNCPPNCNGGGGGNKNSSNWIIIVIILVLLGVLLVMAFIVGFDLYKKTQKANEPKNITVNKHIHSIKSPAIVVSAPQIPAPVPVVASTVAPVVRTSVVPSVVASPINYEVRSFRSPAPDMRSFAIPQVRAPAFKTPEFSTFKTPEVSTFKIPEMDFRAADFELPNNMVSYDGFNLDDVAYSPPIISAFETPCENR